MTDDPGGEAFQEWLGRLKCFVRERLVPLEREVDDRDGIPEPIVAEMKRLGLFGLVIGPEYGGLGLDVQQQADVAFVFGETSAAFRLVFMPNVGLGSRVIALSGTRAQRETYLPGFAAGDLRACFCLTEPDRGADALGIRTTARRVDGGYVLNGTKRCIPNAVRADVFTVMARTGALAEGADSVSAFIVERATPGLIVATPEQQRGRCGTQAADVIFEDVFVPAGSLIGGREGGAFRTAMTVIDSGRIMVAASAAGMARRMIDAASSLMIQGQPQCAPSTKLQLIRAMLADSEKEYVASRAVTLRAAQTLRDGGDARHLVVAAEYFAAGALSGLTDGAVPLLSSVCDRADYCIERFYRDLRTHHIDEGASQILQLAIVRGMLSDYDG